MPTLPSASRTGIPSPLGATWDDGDEAYNFALYSADATDVTLLLYGSDDAATPLATIPFEFPENKTNRIWHLRVGAAQATGATYYGYRIDGPVDPENGHRFDRAKVLLDPYARCVYFPPAHSRAAACVPGANDGRAPLARLPPRQTSAPAIPSRPAPAPRHGHDLVIYEMHVRGFTRRSNSGLDAAIAGTYSGVVAKIPYLKALGVTAVELLPVHQVDPQEGSYWGYMTLGFFAPNGGYASVAANAVGEFRAMVDALHDAGIEVILDVVYNHTTEMGDGGPTYSFRAIDNAVYYALEPGDLASYTNHSGCGNDLRTAHPAVRQLVTDSLRYWAREMNVDGFRFDLASVFLRNEDGSLNLVDPPLISEISSAPELAGIRLIAEPWSGDGSGYVMGRAFPGTSWRQWNDHFRDTVRRFVKGDAGLVGDLITRLYGSTDLFPDDRLSAYRRWQSVNYYDAHDGFNLCDLLSYTDTSQNSWNCGWQGAAGAPADVVALRQRQARNFCCLLMLANGTPMFVAGDEFLHTQQGNPNPYDQDNETTWLDWSLATTHADVLRFYRLMIGFRKAHPSIGRSAGWLDDVTWYGAAGAPDLGPAGTSVAYHLRGARAGDADLYVIANLGWEPQTFQIQAAATWRIAVDTDAASPGDIYEPGTEPAFPPGTQAVVAARSILVLIGPEPESTAN